MTLDTNVLSEIMRAQPAPEVLRWLDAKDPAELWITAVTAAELMFGVARLPDGVRKQQLAHSVSTMLEQDFAGRIFSFDLSAASIYAGMLAQQQRVGRSMPMADAQIASICLSQDTPLVTRNTKDFESLGLVLINPWDAILDGTTP